MVVMVVVVVVLIFMLIMRVVVWGKEIVLIERVVRVVVILVLDDCVIIVIRIFSLISCKWLKSVLDGKLFGVMVFFRIDRLIVSVLMLMKIRLNLVSVRFVGF